MNATWRFTRILSVAAGLLICGAIALQIGAPELNHAQAAAVPTNATVTVAHFAPFAGTAVSTSVTVRVNGTDVITDFVFAEKSVALPLPAGVYTIELVPTGTITPALTTTTTLTEGKEYLLAAVGGANGWPLELYTLASDSTPFTVTGKLRFTHLSPFAPIADLTKVTICTEAGAPVATLLGVPYKATSGYLPLPPGLYDLKVAAGTDCSVIVLDLPPFSMAAGQVVDAFAIGLPGSAELPLQLMQTGLQARVAVGHFAPFASPITSTAVTVRVAGTDLITGFVFGQLTPYVDLPLGNHLVEIIPTGAVTPVLTGTAVVSGYVDFTFAAIGDTINQPLALTRLLDDNVTPPPAGQARLRLAHLAPFANTIAGTRVDLCATVGGTPLVNDIGYQESALLNLPAGLYQVFVAAPAPDCLIKVIDVPEFIVGNGQVAYVYAVGNLVKIPPTVISVPDLTPKRVHLPVIQKE